MRRITTLLFLFFTTVIVLLDNVILTNTYVVEPGPKIISTRGEIWPIPYQRNVTTAYFDIQPAFFKFQVSEIFV